MTDPTIATADPLILERLTDAELPSQVANLILAATVGDKALDTLARPYTGDYSLTVAEPAGFEDSRKVM